MRPTAWLASALTCLACFAPGVANASITYSIVDHPELQMGLVAYHVSGSITTDGALGSWDANHITAWAFTVTDSGGAVVVDVDSTDPGASVKDFSPPIVATATSLTLVSAFGGGGFTLASGSDNSKRLGFMPESDPGFYFANGLLNTTLWLSPVGFGNEFVIAVADAAVPEPGALTMAAVGIGSLLGVRLARGRRDTPRR